MTIVRPCGNGGATTIVEVESSKCKDVDEKKKSWEGAMPTVSLSLISFDECIEESYRKTLYIKSLQKNVWQRIKV